MEDKVNRRHFIELLIGAPIATKYFFFGGIYRPVEPSIVIDRAKKIIYAKGASDDEILDHVISDFGKAAMPLIAAFPYGWGHYRCVDGWKIKRADD